MCARGSRADSAPLIGLADDQQQHQLCDLTRPSSHSSSRPSFRVTLGLGRLYYAHKGRRAPRRRSGIWCEGARVWLGRLGERGSAPVGEAWDSRCSARAVCSCCQSYVVLCSIQRPPVSWLERRRRVGSALAARHLLHIKHMQSVACRRRFSSPSQSECYSHPFREPTFGSTPSPPLPTEQVDPFV